MVQGRSERERKDEPETLVSSPRDFGYLWCMRNRKLYDLLALMSEEDRKRFDLFMASPYFNSSKMLSLFWEQWKEKIYPLPPGVEISASEFADGSLLNRNQIDALCWKMKVKVREFLSQQAYDRQPQLKTVLFTSAIMDRAQGAKPALRELPDLKNELEEEPESPEKHLALLYYHAVINQAYSSSRRTADSWQEEFSKMLGMLEDYVRCKHQQLSCGAINATQIFRQKEEGNLQKLGDSLLHFKEGAHESKLAKLYRLTLSYLLQEDSSETFGELLKILDEHREEIAETPRNEIFGYILNCGIRMVNRGEEQFVEHTFSLYRLLLKKGDLLVNGLLPPQQFKNLIALACRHGALDWVRTFIDTFKSQLTDTHAGLAVSYNEGVLAFYRREYAEAIQIFKPIVSEPGADIFYGLDARSFLWKSYFEYREQLGQAEVDEMFLLYDSFRLFIHRNEKISPQHKEQYRNFIRLFKRFMKCLEKPDPDKRRSSLVSLKGKLETEANLPNRNWFLTKLEERLD